MVVLVLLSTGCAVLSGSQEQYFVCSYDNVWDAALETMKGQSIATYDKKTGQIETNWLDVPSTSEQIGRAHV